MKKETGKAVWFCGLVLGPIHWEPGRFGKPEEESSFNHYQTIK